MQSIKRHTLPITVLALLTLLLGPVAAILGSPCAGSRDLARLSATVQACAGQCSAAKSNCCQGMASESAGACALHNTAKNTRAAHNGNVLFTQARLACTCFVNTTEPPAATTSDATRNRSLLIGSILPILAPAATVHVASPRALGYTPHTTSFLPGSQCDSRPDAGRAPPAA